MRVPDAFDRQDADEQGQDPEAHEFACRYCKVLVYWGDHYNSTGEPGRRLFTVSSRRLHNCSSLVDDFAAVAE